MLSWLTMRSHIGMHFAYNLILSLFEKKFLKKMKCFSNKTASLVLNRYKDVVCMDFCWILSGI